MTYRIVLGLFLTQLVLGCGEGVDLDLPIQINSDNQEAARFGVEAIESLGGRVGASRTQLDIELDPSCSCDNFRTDTTACGSSYLGKVRICPPWFGHGPVIRRVVILHEVAHYLGVHSHLDCSTKEILTPNLSCVTIRDYGPKDLALICQGARGGRCGP